MSFAGERTVHDDLADQLGELVVGNRCLWTRPHAELLTTAATVIDRGPRSAGDPAHRGQGDIHLGAHLGRFCGGI